MLIVFFLLFNLICPFLTWLGLKMNSKETPENIVQQYLAQKIYLWRTTFENEASVKSYVFIFCFCFYFLFLRLVCDCEVMYTFFRYGFGLLFFFY